MRLPESTVTEMWQEIVAYCNFLTRNTFDSPVVKGDYQQRVKATAKFFNSPNRGNGKWKAK